MNKLNRNNYIVKELPSGDNLSISTFTVLSGNPGKNVYIQANVHGAELQGNAVIHELMDYFLHQEFNGTITFVPSANPIGLNQKSGHYTAGRFNPVTGNNWNRNYDDIIKRPPSETGLDIKLFVENHKDSPWEEVFKDFKADLRSAIQTLRENLRARGLSDNKAPNLQLQEFAARADIVLDLHTGGVATRYLYVADYEVESAKNFHFPHMLIIPSKFEGAMDEASFIPWVYLAEEFEKVGRKMEIPFESFTVELGSEERISLTEARDDSNKILHYLKSKGVVEKVLEPIEKSTQSSAFLQDYKSYYSAHGGIVEYLKKPGEEVKKGEVLAVVLAFKELELIGDFEKTLKKVYALEDCIIINHCTSASISQGTEIYQVIENYHTEEFPAN